MYKYIVTGVMQGIGSRKLVNARFAMGQLSGGQIQAHNEKAHLETVLRYRVPFTGL